MLPMKQRTFSQAEYASKKRQTRKDRFLAEIDRVTPWAALIADINPHYPKQNGPGRPPRSLETMLRMYIAQQCFGLSDEGIEDAIYDSMAIRNFVGVDLNIEQAPDATTLLRFRRLLEEHELTKRVFATINNLLNMQGLVLKEGTVVDATIISAPSSPKNEEKTRDPEMHQTKKGNEWHFGMKAHIGVDAHSGAVHTLETTAANVADINKGHALVHGEEKMVFADAGYQGIEKRTSEIKNAQTVWHVAMRPGKRKLLSDKGGELISNVLERLKAKVRAFVEHPFHIIKNIFGLKKVRYKGLAKNTAQLYTLFALANLLITRRRRDMLCATGAP
jgi:IS5 family transposase